MKVDKVTAAIRPRTPYEAIDLGVALARDTGRHIWIPWFIVSLPLFALCNFAAWRLDMVWLGGLLLWWLKPMLDRIPLFVMSRHLFGDTPGTRVTLGALPGLWLQALPGALLWERLDFARSLDLPVVQLEGLKWLARGRRQRVLQRTARGPAVLLTFVCLHLEMVLLWSAWALVLMFVPFEYLPESYKAMWAAFVTNTTPWTQFLINLFWYLAISCIEPIYVGAGFALYLSRRTELEAWDIELAFRRMAERFTSLKQSAAAALVLCAFSLALLCHPRPATAAEERMDVPPAVTRVALPLPYPLLPEAETRFAAGVKTAYADPDVSPHESGGHFEWKDSSKPGKPEQLPAWLQALRHWSKFLGGLVTTFISYWPWLMGVLLLALAVRYRRWLLGWFEPAGAALAADPGRSESVTLEEEALPADVSAAALALWQRGEGRAALALLYRGSVARVQELSGRELPHGATEADCLHAAAGLPTAVGLAVARVVRAWQYAAYAHRLPEAPVFDALIAEWRGNLESRP